MEAEARFHAMGSDAHVIVVADADPAGLLDRAQRRIEQLEQRWSRFLPDSEVSRLSRNAGAPVLVSADTVLLVRRSIEAWHLTGGSFDPTVLGGVSVRVDDEVVDGTVLRRLAEAKRQLRR